jgi:hypothetical protein
MIRKTEGSRELGKYRGTTVKIGVRKKQYAQELVIGTVKIGIKREDWWERFGIDGEF